MFKSLIKVIERLAIAQEESNRINTEFVEHSRKREEESEKLYQEQVEREEKLLEICSTQFQQALDRNNQAIVNYINQRLGEEKYGLTEENE